MSTIYNNVKTISEELADEIKTVAKELAACAYNYGVTVMAEIIAISQSEDELASGFAKNAVCFNEDVTTFLNVLTGEDMEEFPEGLDCKSNISTRDLMSHDELREKIKALKQSAATELWGADENDEDDAGADEYVRVDTPKLIAEIYSQLAECYRSWSSVKDLDVPTLKQGIMDKIAELEKALRMTIENTIPEE